MLNLAPDRLVDTSSLIPHPSSFKQRPRRLRMNPGLRRMVRETTLAPDDFIYPLFVTHNG